MRIVVDSHVHSLASGHAYSTIREIAEEAARKGLEGVAITDHGLMMPGTCSVMHFLSLHSLPNQVFGVRIFPGVELNILNPQGDLDLEERVLKRLVTVMAGIHPHCYSGVTEEDHTNAYLKAMENPHVKIIVHPDNPRYPFDIERVVRRAAETGTALEINDKSADPDNGVREGGIPILKEIIRECIKQGVSLSFGSDSHFFDDVGDFRASLKLAAEMEIPEGLILNTSLEKYVEFLSRGRVV
ncbi:MAG: phosphatase [Treponema sp.]|jgi:putative hydrolase|nr:phosphatase [Treponema sp.]